MGSSFLINQEFNEEEKICLLVLLILTLIRKKHLFRTDPIRVIKLLKFSSKLPFCPGDALSHILSFYPYVSNDTD